MRQIQTYDFFSAQSGAADATSGVFECVYTELASIQVVWDSLGANDATVHAEGSNDNSNWTAIDSATITLNPGTGGSDWIPGLDIVGYAFIRLVYTDNSASAGTVSAKGVFKAA